MKLRNKKTGKVLKMQIHNIGGKEYNSLAEINEEWEDYEEPKEYWYVSSYGNLAKTDVMTDLHRGAEEIGNLFETKEEAEQAVEKLKAWKRLKDKGIKITGWETLCGGVCITTNLDILDVSTRESAILDLLFLEVKNDHNNSME